MKRKTEHPIWLHYSRDDDTKLNTCKYCPKTYSYATAANSLTSLKYHTKNKHLDKLSTGDLTAPPSPAPTPKAQKLKQMSLASSLAPKKSVEQRYAELVCLDGLSFNAVANSSYVRETMPHLGFKSYTSHHTVKQKIQKFFQRAGRGAPLFPRCTMH